MQTRRRPRVFRPGTLALSLAAGLAASAPAPGSTAASCAFSGSAGDVVDRGIVVKNYPGSNIRSVKIGYAANTAGTYQVTMEIHRGTFDGPTVGTSTIYLDLPAGGPDFNDVYGQYYFGTASNGTPVSPGDTLAIIHTVSGPGTLYFDEGTSTTCGGNIYETVGTTPPLDTQRRNTMGIDIEQEDLTTACIPSDTTLCLDDAPGDRRFKLSMGFSHNGGPPGFGQAIPGAALGITHGGTFWFFSQDNPEALVKVLNGCFINGSFWVFFSAGTNVGFTLHVQDTKTSATKTYTNPDNVAALPVQDTSAFPCF